MKKFFASKTGKILLGCLVVLLLGAAAYGGYEFWLYQQPKFQDVTIELGTTTLDLAQFTTKYARLGRCSFASDLSGIDIGKAGDYPVTLSHGKQQEQVILRIVDTTAPKATFRTEVVKPVGYEPDANDFVENYSDFSAVSVFFAEAPVLDDIHAVQTLTVVVEDAHGNSIRQDCSLNLEWMRTELTMELGGTLTVADLLLAEDQFAEAIDPAQIETINASGVGSYTVVGETDGNRTECLVTLQDTTAPVLKLQDWHVYPGNEAKLEDFLVSWEDISGDVELTMLTQPDVDTIGRQTVQIQAKDASGNVTVAEATLNVSNDRIAPQLHGLAEMSIPKYAKPDFLAGITATDNVDETCEITCDTTVVDVTKAGTYYLTYIATDSSGNETAGKRKITVEHDQEDTWALIEELAKTLEKDPEKLRDYVRGNIGYNSQWGGDDPVWYGLKNRAGNCYVHALCLDSLLQYYGYETQLIWVKDKTHYWLLINLEGIGWRHIDPTPSQLHGRYSLMTDAQRLSTLSGRVWDTTAWPAAEEVNETEPKKD
jgi:hypothetical protein